MYVVEWDRARCVALGPALLLVDCGEGTADAWAAGGMRATGPDAIAFTNGTGAHIAGLYGLLCAMADSGRSAPLRLLHRLDEERVGNLVGAYLQSEQSPFPISLEADLPGAMLIVGGLKCTSRAENEGLIWTIEGDDRTVRFSP
jgi:hypothetical protein